MEWSDLRSTFTGDLSQIQPLHDFVIVKYLGSANERASSIILDPGNINVTKDGRIRHNRSTGNRKGVVVACGNGDRLIGYFCQSCWENDMPMEVVVQNRLESARKRVCRSCGEPLERNDEPSGRAEMHVKPGDIVIYPQIPVNDFTCGDDLYTFCHEEQHLLAVLEPSSYQEYKQWRAAIPEMALHVQTHEEA